MDVIFHTSKKFEGSNFCSWNPKGYSLGKNLDSYSKDGNSIEAFNRLKNVFASRDDLCAILNHFEFAECFMKADESLVSNLEGPFYTVRPADSLCNWTFPFMHTMCYLAAKVLQNKNLTQHKSDFRELAILKILEMISAKSDFSARQLVAFKELFQPSVKKCIRMPSFAKASYFTHAIEFKNTYTDALYSFPLNNIFSFFNLVLRSEVLLNSNLHDFFNVKKIGADLQLFTLKENQALFSNEIFLGGWNSFVSESFYHPDSYRFLFEANYNDAQREKLHSLCAARASKFAFKQGFSWINSVQNEESYGYRILIGG